MGQVTGSDEGVEKGEGGRSGISTALLSSQRRNEKIGIQGVSRASGDCVRWAPVCFDVTWKCSQDLRYDIVHETPPRRLLRPPLRFIQGTASPCRSSMSTQVRSLVAAYIHRPPSQRRPATWLAQNSPPPNQCLVRSSPASPRD